jgi:hypothetical protein
MPAVPETQLCADFQAWLHQHHPEWTPYPETGSWDLLLVRAADGCQIGVQAKKHFNATLLRQSLPDRRFAFYGKGSGPDYRAILIPKPAADVLEVCDFCGLICFFRKQGHYGSPDTFQPDLCADAIDRWTGWFPERRHKLPGYVPDVAAGASAPVRLTRWKEGALKICALLEVRGHATREDFKAAGIDHRRWVPAGWLRFDKERGAYIRGPELHFDRQHPDVFRQIVAAVREWPEFNSPTPAGQSP